jgi:hypothetical protein
MARTIEEGGIPTIYLGSCRDMMAQVKAPRNVFVNFPLGHPCGKPDDMELQTQILKDALNYLAEAKIAGDIIDLPYQWDRLFDWTCYLKDIEDMLKSECAEIQEWKQK